MVQTVEIDATSVGQYRDLALYWGESLRFAVTGRPAGAEVIVTLAEDRHADPLIEVPGTDLIALTTLTLETLSEGAGYFYNVWLHDGGELMLLSNGKFTTRASIAPRFLAPVPLSISGDPAAAGQVGVAYGFAPVATGGSRPYGFTLAAGTLPQGLTLDTGTGVITGTPSAAGIAAGLVIRVMDAAGGQADLPAFDLEIAAAAVAPSAFTASATAPLLIVDGDSIMANNPGTRVLLEQNAGHLVRLPDGFQQAVGGQTALDILNGIQATVDLIVPDETIVLMGPIGANLGPGTTSYEEVSGQMGQIFSTLLNAGAVVLAVPTLPDEDVFNTNAKKDQLRDYVYAYDHPNFHAVDIGVANRLEVGAAAYGVGVFDPYAMKNDQSHPNGAGSRYLAGQILAKLDEVIASDIFAAGTNLLTATDAVFGGQVAATDGATTGTIPEGWDVAATGSGVSWTCAANGAGDFVVSITGAAAVSTLTIAKTVTLNAVLGDIFDFAAEVEITAGASGLRFLRAMGEGATSIVTNSDFGPEGMVRVRTPSTAYAGAVTSDTFAIQAIVDAGATVTLTFRKAALFHVGNVDGLLQISGTPDTTATVGSAYSFAPTVIGGTAPYSFDLASGTLPAGLSLNSATGAITGTPTTEETQAGIALRVTDTASDTAVLAAFTLAVSSAGAPVNTALPLIDNTSPVEGDVLTATTGGWTNSPTGYAYQWRSSGFVIPGATSATYTVQAGDVDQTLRVEVVASNGSGSSAAAPSAETAIVQAAAGSVAAWDSGLNNASDLAYTDSDRVVTSSAGSDRHTRGTQALTGKRYFEVAVVADIRAVGVADETITALSGKTNGVNRSFWSGDTFFAGTVTGMGMNLSNVTVIQVAVDIDADLIWVRGDGTGNWNGNASADPATGAGGVDISGMTSSTLYAYVSTKPNGAGRLDGTADRFTHTPPVGFSAIL